MEYILAFSKAKLHRYPFSTASCGNNGDDSSASYASFLKSNDNIKMAVTYQNQTEFTEI